MSALFRRRKSSTPSAPAVDPQLDAALADGSQTTLITGDRQRDTDRVRLLIDSLRTVSSAAEDPDELLVSMVDRAVRTVGAERGLLFTPGADGRPVLRVGRTAAETDLPPGPTWSSQVVEQVLSGGASVCKRDDDAADFDPSQSMISLNIRAVMCVPLVFQDKRPGVIYVDARASERLFARSDLRFFEAFADMLSIVWANRLAMERLLRGERMRRELELVRELQGHLLPRAALHEHGFSLCGKVIPADEAGGDYFDFFDTADGRMAMVVGDVSGHGVGPALFMSGGRAYLRSYCQAADSPGRVLAQINRHLTGDMRDDMFMSMFLCVLDPHACTLRYANAGHPPPLCVHGSDGRCEDYARTGMALGVESEAAWDERGPHTLAPGDTIVMFSDGIIELRRGDEQYGRQRLADSVLRHRARPAEELLQVLFDEALEWAGGDEARQDDLTLAILQADS